MKKPFSAVGSLVLSQVNLSLKETRSRSSRCSSKIDFSNEESGNRLSGLYTVTGLLGMLKATNFNSIDMVSSFIGL